MGGEKENTRNKDEMSNRKNEDGTEGMEAMAKEDMARSRKMVCKVKEDTARTSSNSL